MSYTEIFGFDKEGNAYFAGETKNAFRSAMAIWRILEERYLPPHRPSYIPEHIQDDEIEKFCHYKPSRCTDMFNDKAMQEIWNLSDNDKVSEIDKIVLFTTFDRCLVKKEDIEKVIKAFEEFEGETSLKEQAEVLKELLKDDNCIAVGWNQTSVNCDTWLGYDYDEDNDETIPYNCLENDKHYWLFDALNIK
ncbi:hypothetical protein ACR77J_15845 [Tissierella praeacuta]|uniref:hypothetical protein n=1 Tax=Tissierella praeacuta TaxID=43131 RepID=UPI003DA5C3E9